MLRTLFFITTIFISISRLFSQNSYPIILIHGFLGWGRDEMEGYYYWGGRTDLEAVLREGGYEVYTVSVGPISPNFDRAIEAFYQIKGGQVDYGNEKTERLGIIQRPPQKNYTGLYPLWDSDHPVHIISHSQGGQTARMLEMLLKRSTPGETSLLLSNEHYGWIKSITTISTPHNGSTLVPIFMDVFPFALNLAPWFGGIDIENVNNLYSFDLEQWSVDRYPGESLMEYYHRIGDSPLAKSKNLCTWDLSLEGSAEFNENYTIDPDVYYFSFSTYATHSENKNGNHRPDSKMSFHLWSTSLLMGYDDNAPDSAWYENDGVCNTISMTHPFGSPVKTFDGFCQKGIWQVCEKLHMDHEAVIGHHVSKSKFKNIIVIYNEHAELLYSLK